MADELDYGTAAVVKTVVCLECGTELGGEGQPDPYSHMLHCLNVTPDKVERIREVAQANRTENGKRVAHLCDFILGGTQ